MPAIEERDEAQSYYVVLVQPHGERVVFDGRLGQCQAWLALNGDKVEDGHYEIRDEPARVRRHLPSSGRHGR